MKKALQISAFFFLGILNAQVGIGTSSPNATLHLEPSNIVSPNGKDGILIPKVNQFSSVAQAKGQTVFLENHSTLPDGFYYWDGEDWNSYLISGFDRTFDKSIYVATGVGYSGSGTVERTVYFDTLKANGASGFSISGNNITIGKSGNYIVSFNSALKKSSAPAYRAIYTYHVKRGSTSLLSTSNSIPNEATTATSVALSGIVKLSAGDVINVTIQKNDEAHTDNTYTGYGTNCLTFTYLND